MLSGAQTRTIFAGLGVTGCLIGAIGAIFAVTGGVLAFAGWPQAPVQGGARALSFTDAGAPRHPAQPIHLTASPNPPVVVSSPQRGGVARQATSGRPTTTSRVTPSAPPRHGARPPAPGSPSGTGGAGPTGLAAIGRGATGTVSKTIRSVGAAVPAAAPVTNAAADTVDAVGHALWPGVTGPR